MGPHRLNLATLREAPHGLDLGALEPGRLTGFRATADGAVDVAPDDFVTEARRQLPAEANRETDGLVLVGRRQVHSNNSWMHNAGRLMKGSARCTVLVHPRDAAPRRLATGDVAWLGSAAGSVLVPVEVTDEVRPGVVSMPHGWGHDRDGVRLHVARAHAGASANDVTSEHHLDTLTGNAAFNGLPVTLERDSP